MRLYTYMVMLVLAVSFAAGIQITKIKPQGSQPYNSSFSVDIATDSKANITLTFNGREHNRSNITTASFTLSPPDKEGTEKVTVNATDAQNASNTVGNTTTVKIDTKQPRITNLKVNKDNATLNESFNISATVHDENIKNVTVGNDASFTSTKTSLQNDTADSWSLLTDASEMDCQTGSCTLRVQSIDVVGQRNSTTVSIKIINQTASSKDNETTNPITILQPENKTTVSDSHFKTRVQVNTSTMTPKEAFCEYEWTNTTSGGPAGFYLSPIPNKLQSNPDFGNYDRGQFSKNGDIWTINDTFQRVKNQDITYTVHCFGDTSNYSQTISFTVEDTTSPDPILSVEDTGYDTATFRITSKEHVIISNIEQRKTNKENVTSITTPSKAYTNYTFNITGLANATQYSIKIQGNDYAGNSFSHPLSETFTTKGKNTTNKTNTSKEPSLAEQLHNTSKKGETDTQKEPFVGSNYSYARSWLYPGKETKRLVKNFEMNLREILVKPREKLRNVHVNLITTRSPPNWVEKPANVSVFEYYKIDTRNLPDAKLEYVKLRFEVSNDWKETNDVDSVALYRKTNGTWDQLPTTTVEKGPLFTKYQALSPGFSLFAVAGKQLESAEVSVPVKNKPENETTVSNTTEKNTTENTTVNTTAVSAEEETSSGLSWPLQLFGGVLLVLLLYLAYVAYDMMEDEGSDDHEMLKRHVQRLEQFVEQAVEQGHDEEALRERLIEKGWDERLVDFVLRKRK